MAAHLWRALVGGAAIALAVAVGTIGHAQDAGPGTVWDGVYSEPQAERGLKRYAASCEMCHGGEMTGGGGVPGLVGAEFLFGYSNKTAADLFTYLKENMPPGQAGSLSDQQYVDIVAAVFKANGFPASASRELPATAGGLGAVKILKARP